MNGPEHYREAERLTRQALPISDPDAALVLAQLATAHATLALAAATALSDPTRSASRASIPEWDAWQVAAGVKTQKSGGDDHA